MADAPIAADVAQLKDLLRQFGSQDDFEAWGRICARLAESRSAATQSGGAWVKCSERMPEESQLIWFVADGRVHRGFFVCGEFVNSGFFSWAANDVSHWMPRAPYPQPPDPPKGDTDG